MGHIIPSKSRVSRAGVVREICKKNRMRAGNEWLQMHEYPRVNFEEQIQVLYNRENVYMSVCQYERISVRY